MMARALAELASGNTIRLSVFGGELSTQEVADLLGVSRPFVVKEIEEGRLPARKVGPRRRVAKSDFIAYRHKLDAKQQHSLNELAGIDQELGLVSTFPVGDTSIPLSQNRELGTND
ncbi:MAG: DNA-binding protein [Phycisphaeraceae bacterium]|nr:MAG: DNA-binding protein [Phycisphaeraceae bacterium]